MSKERPEFDQMIDTLVRNKSISQNEAEKFKGNYTLFESKRENIVRSHTNQWAAALNGELHTASNLKELEGKLKDNPDHKYAYIEQIPTPQRSR